MDLATFERSIGDAEVVPVIRATAMDPTRRSLPRALATSDSAFLLESSGSGWEADGRALLGFRPRGIWRARGHQVEWIEGSNVTSSVEERPLESLRRFFKRRPRIAGLPRFSGGLVGYLGWGAVRWFEPSAPARHGPDLRFPDAELMLVEDLAAVDGSKGQTTLIANVELARYADTHAAYRAAQERLDHLERALSQTVPDGDVRDGEPPVGLGAVRDEWSQAGFESAVQRILEHIAAGDCMQAVLSRRLVASFTGSPLSLYERLRQVSPVPYHFLIRFGQGEQQRCIVGASPELLVRVENGHVTVRPIAGTRPRGKTPAEDLEHEAALRADPKELAEHVMLVDLGRNDVGRVAESGTVRVEQQAAVTYFSHVMHLVSRVGGTLRPGLTALDALAAAFPAGTVSGAPKVRAIQIIDALESSSRGPYGGAVGTIGYDGDLVMAIHLRSLALAGQELRLQAGAGIVSDSVPTNEFAETEGKLAAVRTALGDSAAWRRW